MYFIVCIRQAREVALGEKRSETPDRQEQALTAICILCSLPLGSHDHGFSYSLNMLRRLGAFSQSVVRGTGSSPMKKIAYCHWHLPGASMVQVVEISLRKYYQLIQLVLPFYRQHSAGAIL